MIKVCFKLLLIYKWYITIYLPNKYQFFLIYLIKTQIKHLINDPIIIMVHFANETLHQSSKLTKSNN